MPVTTASQWKKSSGTQELELPSGNVCLVKKLDPVELISSDIFPDSMTREAQEQVDSKRKPADRKPKADADSKTAQGIMSIPREDREKMFRSFDTVTAMAVVKPKVVHHRDLKPGEDRDKDAIYTDDVDFADKVKIFEFALGDMSKLSPFRSESGADVGGVDASKSVPGTTK